MKTATRETQLSIREIFEAFYQSEKRAGASDSMLKSCGRVLSLFGDFLNGYAYQYLDEAESARYEAACKKDEEDAFIRTFGAEHVVHNVDEFLNDFMVRKVMSGANFKKSAATVCKKFVKYIGKQGYIEGTDAAQAASTASRASSSLPRVEKLANALFHWASETAPEDVQETLEDRFTVVRRSEAAVWLEGMMYARTVGPVKLPRAIIEAWEDGWHATLILGRRGKAWHILETGNVYP
jgi:hypothetical protein